MGDVNDERADVAAAFELLELVAQKTEKPLGDGDHDIQERTESGSSERNLAEICGKSGKKL